MSLYDKTITCLYCNEKFKSKSVKTSSLRPGKVDEDGYTYYDEEANPYLYQIYACPHCGFVFTGSFSLMTREKTLVKESFIDRLASVENYCGRRTVQEAIEVWKLGLLTGQVSNQPTEIMAGIALRISWLYRFSNDHENEMNFLERALNGYKQAYQNDDLINSELGVVKIIFQAAIRLEDLEEARIWMNELYKYRSSKVLMDAKEQYDNLKESIEEEKN